MDLFVLQYMKVTDPFAVPENLECCVWVGGAIGPTVLEGEDVSAFSIEILVDFVTSY